MEPTGCVWRESLAGTYTTNPSSVIFVQERPTVTDADEECP